MEIRALGSDHAVSRRLMLGFLGTGAVTVIGTLGFAGPEDGTENLTVICGAPEPVTTTTTAPTTTTTTAPVVKPAFTG